MRRLIQTCHKRNAPATTGMVPFVLAQAPPDQDMIQQTRDVRNTLYMQVCVTKRETYEAQAGSDGALVYDVNLVSIVQQVSCDNQSHISDASTRCFPLRL